LSSAVARTAVLRDRLTGLRDQGHRRPGDPELIGVAIGAMLTALVYEMPVGETTRSDDQIIDTLTGLPLHGLAGPGSPP
jgi:hypothetical protein